MKADERRIVRGDMADRDIGFLVAQIGQGVGRHDRDGDFRRPAADVLNDWGQDVGCIGVGCGNADTPANSLNAATGRDSDRLGGAAHITDMIEQLQPGSGQLQSATDTLEKGNAKLCLQRSDLPRQGGLCQAECAGRGRKRSGRGRGVKCADVIPVGLLHANSHMASADFVNSQIWRICYTSVEPGGIGA
jgi:hypothetical protein